MEDLARRLEGPDGLTRERSTFSRHEVVQVFAQAAAAGARVEAIEHATNAFLSRDEVVAVGERVGERRYTTRAAARRARAARPRRAPPRRRDPKDPVRTQYPLAPKAQAITSTGAS